MSTQAAPRRPPPLALVRLAVGLRRTLLRAADAVVPGYLSISERLMGASTTAALHVVARLRIADLLADGPLTIDELAARTGSDRDALHRVMRALVAVNLFRLEGREAFAHNHVSRSLITGRFGNIRGFAEFLGHPAQLHAWADLHATVAQGGNAFERQHGRTVWAWPGCDAYLLKTVLHNWPDDAALRILRNCRAAMQPGQHVALGRVNPLPGDLAVFEGIAT